MPLFWKYFRSVLLPTISMWSKLCLGDLSRYNGDYKNHLSVPRGKGKNYLMSNLTNAQMEKFFSIKKIDRTQLRLSVVDFVQKCYRDNISLKRQFILNLRQRLGNEGKCMTDAEVKNLEKILRHSEDKEEDPEESKNVQIPTENWGKKDETPKGKYPAHCGLYQQPPTCRIHFTPNVQMEKIKKEDLHSIKWVPQV